MAKSALQRRPIDRAIELYGDLVFDLCESVLWSPSNAQIAFRTILRDIRKGLKAQPYDRFERAWVLRIACDRLRALSGRLGKRLSPSEQVMLDATLDLDARMGQFDSYFHRLRAEDQILLLLRDKYGLPYAEIAAVSGIPEGTLKVRRQQALRTLEEWLWAEGGPTA